MATQAGQLRTFRPLWAMVAAWLTGVLAVGGLLFVGLLPHGPAATATADRWGFVGFAAFVAVVLWRLGGVRASPSPDGIVVRNILRTRRLAWAQIVVVRMSAGDPWVVLDLADGTTQPVMAVQRADGERGMAEARRLSRLVRELGETTEPGSPTDGNPGPR